MTEEYALPPREALGMIAATGAADPAKLIRDHAEVGMVRTYALVISITNQAGERTIYRGSRVPNDLWTRIIRDGVDADAWTGGTVRLIGSDLIGGEPTVHITGIAFHAGDVERLARQQRTPPPAAKPRPAAEASAATADEAFPSKPRRSRKPDPDAIPPGAILCTIAQAAAALGIGRTKVNELMKAGRLVRVEIDGGVRITVESVMALAGAGSQA